MNDTPFLAGDGADLPDMAAGELALGVLEGEERAAALRRVLAEPAFAADVSRWRDRLGPWFGRWAETAPPPGLLGRIEASLDAPAATAVAPLPVRWVWPSLAGVASLAAAVLAVLLVSRPPPPPAPAPIVTVAARLPDNMLVAALAQEKGEAVKAVYDPDSGGLRITGVPREDAGHAIELWVIAGDGVPHALGLVRAAATSLAIDPANRARLAAGATLAVSIEPAGGSPTGLPTGPVIAKGALSIV